MHKEEQKIYVLRQMSTRVLQTDIFYYLSQERMTLQNNTFGDAPANTMFWQWATHYLFRDWWLRFVPAGLTLKILHTQCHRVFVWLPKLTAICIYSITSLVCIVEGKCVYCAVRAGSLNMLEANFCFKRSLEIFSLSYFDLPISTAT